MLPRRRIPLPRNRAAARPLQPRHQARLLHRVRTMNTNLWLPGRHSRRRPLTAALTSWPRGLPIRYRLRAGHHIRNRRRMRNRRRVRSLRRLRYLRRVRSRRIARRNQNNEEPQQNAVLILEPNMGHNKFKFFYYNQHQLIGKGWSSPAFLCENPNWTPRLPNGVCFQEGPLSRYFASGPYFLLLWKLWWNKTLTTPVFKNEARDLFKRRWILASEPGPVARENLSQVDNGLGWDGRISEVRPSLSYCTKITRFIYRGNLWVNDILDVENPTGIFGMNLTEARRRICRVSPYLY